MKTPLLAIIAVLFSAACAQAQYLTLDFSSYYSFYQPSPLQYDAQTQVLTINGTKADDEVFIQLSYNKMVVTMTTLKQSYSEEFDGYEVKRIVFNGSDGNDSFEFSNLALMQWYLQYYRMFDIVCDLNGGNGTDFLSGGVKDDLLNGGADGCQDVLIGNNGGDLFVRSRISATGDGTFTYYYMIENEVRVDFDSYEGDMLIFEDELDEFLNQSSEDSSDTSSSSNSTSTIYYTTFNLLSY